MKTRIVTLCLAALLAAASWSYAGVLFDDNFDAIPDGQPDPAWLPLIGSWEVQSGQYTSGAGDGPWQWSVVDGLTVGDVEVSADMLTSDGGLLVRMPTPTVGENPQSQFVLLHVDAGGISVYHNPWSNLAGAAYTDGSHPGEWVNINVRVVGSQFSAWAKNTGGTVIANIPEFTISGMSLTGSVGLYGFSGKDAQYDNFVVQAVPEPGSLAAISLGLISLCGIVRRRR